MAVIMEWDLLFQLIASCWVYTYVSDKMKNVVLFLLNSMVETLIVTFAGRGSGLWDEGTVKGGRDVNRLSYYV
jgi:hypothetical protein